MIIFRGKVNSTHFLKKICLFTLENICKMSVFYIFTTLRVIKQFKDVLDTLYQLRHFHERSEQIVFNIFTDSRPIRT